MLSFGLKSRLKLTQSFKNKMTIVKWLSLITLIQLMFQNQVDATVFVNMDIDIDQGDYMVNSQCVYAF